MKKKDELTRRQARKLLQKAKTKYNKEHPEVTQHLKAIHEARRKERELAKELRERVRYEKRKLRNLKAKDRKAEARKNPRQFLHKMASWLIVPKAVKKAEKKLAEAEAELKEAVHV